MNFFFAKLQIPRVNFTNKVHLLQRNDLSEYFCTRALLVFALIILFPFTASAQVSGQKCSPIGYTIATINGIFTDKNGAIANKSALKKKFLSTHNNEPLNIEYLYNPSHLGGAGDLLMSAYQKYFENEMVQDHDLITMLTDASAKVATQKFLIIAHSQGNFYANSMYDVLADKTGGVPAQSLAVYAVATPASRVAGNGLYLTSSTDGIIAGIVAYTPYRNIMSPNTHIREVVGWNPILGHDFSQAYLKYRADRIVVDVQTSLSKLSTNTIQDTQLPCISTPKLSIAYKVGDVLLTVVDYPIGIAKNTGVYVAVATYRGVMAVGTVAVNSLIAIGNTTIAIASTGATMVGTAFQYSAQLFATIAPAETQVAILSSKLAGQAKVLFSDNNTQEDEQHLSKKSSDLLAPLAPSTYLEDSVSVLATGTGLEAKQFASSSTFLQDAVHPPVTYLQENPVKVESIVYIATSTTTLKPVFSWNDANSGGASGSDPPSAQNTSATTTAITTTTSVATTTATTSDTVVFFSASTTPPILTIIECNYSLSTSFCLVATTTVAVSWSTPLGTTRYDLLVNGTMAQTLTVASTSLDITNLASTTINIIAYDASSATATSSSRLVYAYIQPVVINEIMWTGDTVDAGREWVELKNNTPYSIDASQLTLHATEGGTQYIPLSGTLPPRSYMNGMRIVQRMSDAPLNPQANIGLDFSPILQVFPFKKLADTGQQLSLGWYNSNSTTTIDITPVISICGGWCAGSLSTTTLNGAVSMERISATTSGAVAQNWASNDTFHASANMPGGWGQPLYATVLAENSPHWPALGWFCSPDTWPIVAGQVYRPPSSNCIYLARFVSWPSQVSGALFSGDVGSSTLIAIHSAWYFKDGLVSSANDTITNAQVGDNFFVAMWKFEDATSLPSYDNSMVSWLSKGHRLVGSRDNPILSTDTDPPNINYRIIPFTYGL